MLNSIEDGYTYSPYEALLNKENTTKIHSLIKP